MRIPAESDFKPNFPCIMVQVTAPTYPGVDFRPILEFYRAQTFPVIPDFDLQTVAENAIDAALALPRESLVVVPSYPEGIIFNTEDIPGGTPGLYISIVADSEASSIALVVANPEATANVASCNSSYTLHSGSFVPGVDVELQSLVSQNVYASSGAYPISFMPEDFLIPCRDGTKEVGFREIYRLKQDSAGNWVVA